MKHRLPVIIFGGSDAHRGTIPAGFAAADMLSGCKGAVRLPSGRCIAGELVVRMRASERFLDPILIGPRDAYEGLLDCEMIDVRGDLLATIAAAEAISQERYGPLQPVAISACDVLPTADEINELLAEGYEPNAACGLWWQLVATEPAELGASSWKPSYRIAPYPGAPPATMYPGHLVIVRPRALRFEALKLFLNLAYRYRNRGLYERALCMTLHAIGTMVTDDLHQLASFHLSYRTLSVPWLALGACRQLRAGRLTVKDMENVAGKVIIEADFHRRLQQRSVTFSVTGIRSFAKDIDTRVELEEAFRSGQAG